MKTFRQETKKCPYCGEEFDVADNWAFDCCPNCEKRWTETHSYREDD